LDISIRTLISGQPSALPNSGRREKRTAHASNNDNLHTTSFLQVRHFYLKPFERKSF
jgi:hypothetical protein